MPCTFCQQKIERMQERTAKLRVQVPLPVSVPVQATVGCLSDAENRSIGSRDSWRFAAVPKSCSEHWVGPSPNPNPRFKDALPSAGLRYARSVSHGGFRHLPIKPSAICAHRACPQRTMSPDWEASCGPVERTRLVPGRIRVSPRHRAGCRVSRSLHALALGLAAPGCHSHHGTVFRRLVGTS